MRSTVLYFEGTPQPDLTFYEEAVRSYGYEPSMREIDPNTARALMHKLDGYSQLWIHVPFREVVPHLTTRGFSPYTLEDAERKTGNLIASAIRSVLGIDPKTVAFMLGGSSTPVAVHYVITAADTGIPAIGSTIVPDMDAQALLRKLLGADAFA